MNGLFGEKIKAHVFSYVVLVAWVIFVSAAAACGTHVDSAAKSGRAVQDSAARDREGVDVRQDGSLPTGMAGEQSTFEASSMDGSNSDQQLDAGSASGVSPLNVIIDADHAPVVGRPLTVAVTMSLQSDSHWWPIILNDNGARGSVFIAMGNEFAVTGGSPSNYVVELAPDSDQTRVFWHNVLVPIAQPLVLTLQLSPVRPTTFSLLTASFNQLGTKNGAAGELYAGIGSQTNEGYVSNAFTADIAERQRIRYANITPSSTIIGP